MKRSVSLLLVLLFVSTVHAVAQDGFVKVKGSRFEVDGKPYRYIGTNMWYGCYLGSTLVDGGRARLVRELDAMKKNGIDNIRVLGASEASDFNNHFPFTIQDKPGDYNEALLEGLDFLLYEMGKRKMYAVVYLTNYWNWSGGMGQYTVWFDSLTAASIPHDDQKTWEREMKLSTLFYSNAKAQKAYRDYIQYLINRTNKFSGKTYRDDPAIMAWQLGNEPRPGIDGPHGDAARKIFVTWIHGTAEYIKSLDENHLVSTGNEGQFGSIQDLGLYKQAHNVSAIDYLTVHIWAKNWSWFKANDARSTYPTAEKNAREHLQKHIDLATELNKPIVLEEFGLDRDKLSNTPGTAVTLRDRYFRGLFQVLYENAAAGKAAAGANFWAWGGEGKPMKDIEANITVEKFVGDPFIEPQGLNSVFIQDASTLKIIREFSKKMRAIRK